MMTVQEPGGGAEAGRVLVRLCEGQVTLEGQRVLSRIGLCIRQGGHMTLQGANGAGKSTLLRVLRGLQWLDQREGGDIRWYPEAVGEAAAEGAAGSGDESVLFEPPGADAPGADAPGDDTSLCEPGGETSPLAGRSMAALVCAAEQERVLGQSWPITVEDAIHGGLTDALFVRPDSATPAERVRIRRAAALARVEGVLDRQVTTLSQGELRLTLIARALVREPALLLLDEVTDGLDASARDELLGVLHALSGQCTLVVSSHRPDTLPPWIGRRVVLRNGQVVFDGPSRLAPPPDEGNRVTEAPLPLPVSDGAAMHVRDATVYLDGKAVLHDINWHIRPGEHWLVRGPNGAGKSTLLRVLAGDLTPAWGGEITRYLPRQGGEVRCLAQVRRGVRLVSDLSQATYGYNLRGDELVASGLDNSVGLYRVLTDPEQALVADALRLLGVERLAQRPFRSCSTGEARRLLLARAIVGHPDVLLLDEPCSGLDAAGRHDVERLLERLMASGVQVVLVTHHAEDRMPGLTHSLTLEHGRADFS